MVDFSALFNDFPGGWGILLGILFLVLMTNACHEGGHALMAWWNGDRRRALLRRCTLNPIVHFHWLLTLVLPVLALYFFGFVVGGARPVMINAGGIGPRRMALVGLAGPTGNFLFAGFAVAFLGLAIHLEWLDRIDLASEPVWLMVVPATWFSVLLGVFNLLPLPPFDGSRVVGMLLPERVRAVYYGLFPLGLILGIGIFLWYSGALYYELGIQAFGQGHPNDLRQGLPQLIEDGALEMSRFWERTL